MQAVVVETADLRSVLPPGGRWPNVATEVLAGMRRALQQQAKAKESGATWQVGYTDPLLPDDANYVNLTVFLPSQFKENAVKEGVELVLKRLELTYTDMLTVHVPFNRDIASLQSLWRLAEQLHSEGKTKALGVVGFKLAELELLLSYATVKPSVNQIPSRGWPTDNLNALIEFGKQHDIEMQSTSSMDCLDQQSAAIPTAPELTQLLAEYGKMPPDGKVFRCDSLVRYKTVNRCRTTIAGRGFVAHVVAADK